MSFKEWDADKRSKSDELLRRGKYRHLLLPHQKTFYDLIANGTESQYGLYCSRKQGKSFTITIIAFEFAQNNPGSIQRIVLPSKVLAKEIYFAIYQELKDIIPTELMPTMLKMEAAFQFANGSRIVLGGSQAENIEQSRGPLAHRIYRDEVTAWNAANYEYATFSVLAPQGTTVPNFMFIDTTTPPKSPSHPWIQVDYPKLVSKGALKTFDIYQNSLLTPQMIDKIIDQYGGVDNPNFQREHLCMLVADQSLRLTPEFVRDTYVTELPKLEDNFGNPIVCQPVIGSDLGLNDNTFHVFGYHHYALDKYIVLDEWVDSYKTFDKIVDAYNKGVVENFPKSDFLEPDCVADIWEIARHTLRNDYGWNMRAPTKGQTAETIAFLRDCLVNNKLIISPKCVNLIHELTVGIWAPNRKDIDRGGTVGHADGVMALAYALKAVPWGRRPSDAVQLKFGGIKGAKRR